jgi:hypothetical protein
VYRSRRVQPDEFEDLERLAQYIIGLRPPSRPDPDRDGSEGVWSYFLQSSPQL